MKKIFFVIPLLCSIASLATAAPIIQLGDINLDQVIGSPPAVNSDAEKSDFNQVKAWQAKRSAADCARAGREASGNAFLLWGPPDGPLKSSEIAHWQSLSDSFKEDLDPFIIFGKDHWKRLRPYVGHQEIVVCQTFQAPPSDNFSYPSGHSVVAYFYANMLSYLDPNRSKVFFARADQIASDRVIAGVHFPSDIDAGKKLAKKIFNKLFEYSTFRKQLDQAK